MFGFLAPRQRPGRIVSVPAINRPSAEVARQSRARPGGALAAIVAAGATLPYSTRRRKFLIRITAVGTSTQAGSYSWQAIAPDPDNPGSYLDLAGWTGALGGDAFFEDNGVTHLAIGDRVEVEREWYSGEVRAQFDHC